MNKTEYLRKFFDDNPNATKDDAQTYLNNFRNDGGNFDGDAPKGKTFQEMYQLNPTAMGYNVLNKGINAPQHDKKIHARIFATEESRLYGNAMKRLTSQPDYKSTPYEETEFYKTIQPYQVDAEGKTIEQNEDFIDVNTVIREDLGFYNPDGTVDYKAEIDYDFYLHLKEKEWEEMRKNEDPRVFQTIEERKIIKELPFGQPDLPLGDKEIPSEYLSPSPIAATILKDHFSLVKEEFTKRDMLLPFNRYLAETIFDKENVNIGGKVVDMEDVVSFDEFGIPTYQSDDPVFTVTKETGLKLYKDGKPFKFMDEALAISNASNDWYAEKTFFEKAEQGMLGKGENISGGYNQDEKLSFGTQMNWSLISSRLQKQYYNNLMIGNQEEANQILEKYNFIVNKYGAALSPEGGGVFKRLATEWMFSSLPMLDAEARALLVGSLVPFPTKKGKAIQGLTQRTVSFAEWQQQGSGQLLMNLYSDTDENGNLYNYTEKERKQHLVVATAIGTLYSLVERASAALPFLKSQGNMFSRRLATSLMRKALTDPSFRKTLTRAGAQGTITYFAELGEEGVQELLQTLGFQLTAKDEKVVASDLFKSLGQGMWDARYGVFGFGTVNFVNELRTTKIDIKNVDLNTKALVNAGYSQEEAQQIAIERVGGGKLTTKKADREQAVIKIQAAQIINNKITNDRTEAETLAKQLIENDYSKESQLEVGKVGFKNEVKNIIEKLSIDKDFNITISDKEIERVLNKTEEQLEKNKSLPKEKQTPLAQTELLNNVMRSVLVNNLVKQGINRRVATRVVMHTSKGTQQGLTQAANSLRNAFEKQSNNGINKDEKFAYDKFFSSISLSQIKKMQKDLNSPAAREAVLSNGKLNQKARVLLRQALASSKEADIAKYNAYVASLRDAVYERFLSDNNLGKFASASSLIQFPKHYEQQILDGQFDDIIREEHEAEGKEVTQEFIETEGRQQYLTKMKNIYAQQQAMEEAEQKDRDNERKKLDLQRRKQIRDFRDRVLKSLNKIAPNAKVRIHSNTNDYINNTGQRGTAATFNPLNFTLDIDGDEASFFSVIHETFHALFETVTRLDGDLEASLQETVDIVKANLKPALRLKLEAIMRAYQNETYQNEEYLVQALELITREYHTLNAQAKRAIRNIIDKVLDFIGAGRYKKEFYDFGFTKDFTHLSKEELKRKAELLGVKGYKRMSRENLLKNIDNNRSIEELKVITAMQTLAVKVYEGMPVSLKDLNFLRVNPASRRGNLIKYIKSAMNDPNLDFANVNAEIRYDTPTSKGVIYFNDKKLTELTTDELVFALEEIYLTNQTKAQKITTELELPDIPTKIVEELYFQPDLTADDVLLLGEENQTKTRRVVDLSTEELRKRALDETKQKVLKEGKTIEKPARLTKKIKEKLNKQLGKTVVVTRKSEEMPTDSIGGISSPIENEFNLSDDDVKPLIVFHGVSSSTQFDSLKGQERDRRQNDTGIHFGGFRIAKKFAGMRAGRYSKQKMYAAYLRIENPLYFGNWNTGVPRLETWIKVIEENIAKQEGTLPINKDNITRRRLKMYSEMKKFLIAELKLVIQQMAKIGLSKSKEFYQFNITPKKQIENLIKKLENLNTLEQMADPDNGVLDVYQAFFEEGKYTDTETLDKVLPFFVSTGYDSQDFDNKNYIKNITKQVAIQSAGFDGVIYDNQFDIAALEEAVDRGDSIQNYIVFNESQIIPIYSPDGQNAEEGAIETFGVVKAAKKLPSSDFEESLDAFEEDLMDLIVTLILN